MDDLVKRLRRMDGDSMSIKTLDEAADRIEALEAALRDANEFAHGLAFLESKTLSDWAKRVEAKTAAALAGDA